MNKWKFLKKTAPVMLSVAVAASSFPVTAFAAEDAFSDVETFAETSEENVQPVETEAGSDDSLEVFQEPAAAETAPEETQEVETFSADEDLFSSGTEEELFTEEAGTEDLFSGGEEETAEYQYVYAGLSWSQYWAAEGVYDAGDTSSSGEADTRGEYDKGAFDAVTRSTVNHGLHRGSYQCTAIIFDTDGNSYPVSYWTSSSNAVLTDGSSITFSRGTITKADGSSATMDYYVVTGMKYVPVKVKTADYEDFCAQYQVVENDSMVAGGYSENNLVAYQKTAAVTENTNGLKTAVKNEDGSFSFSARATGSDSGLKDEALKTASDIVVTVKPGDGTYGEFLRVDLTGSGYGDLGSNMYAVRWTYYGSDSTCSTPLASYGTKFAADNWMHKANGIQLGLTDSLRCQLPEGTDGTGCWVITVYAMGYADYSFAIQADASNIVGAESEEIDTTALEAAVADADALVQDDYTEGSWEAMQLELREAKDELAAPHTQAMVDEALAHLTQAVTDLVKKYYYGTVNLPYADFYYGELNDIAADAAMNLEAADPVTAAGYREAGAYDSVTSATDSKYKGFASTYYTTGETGGTIDGIANVAIQVPGDLYKAATAAIAAGQTCSNRLLDIVGSMQLMDTVPAEYKVLNGDGTLTAMVTETVNDENAQVSISCSSVWGNYQISVTSDYIPSKDVMMGAILETSDGAKYGLSHLHNLWLQTKEIAVTCEPDFTEPHGNYPYIARFADLPGKTITKITYLTRDGADLVLDVNLYCKVLVDDSTCSAAAQDGIYDAAGVQVPVTLTAPQDSSYALESVEFGGNVLTEGTDYQYADNVLTIFGTDNTNIGEYTLTFVDDIYENVEASFILGSGLSDGEVVLENNALSIGGGISVDAYLNNITAVEIDGKAVQVGRRQTVAGAVFNADGTINFDGTDSAGALFTKGEGASYEITVTAAGFPAVSGTAVSPAPQITLSKTSATVYVNGNTVTLTATLKDLTGDVTFTSSDTSIAKVSAVGKVTGVKAGTATITATCGEKSAACKVTVKNAALKLNKTKATIYTKGSSTKVTLTAAKTGISGTVTYKSSNTKVATVSSKGVVTAKKAGTATITAACGSLKATCKVTVKVPSLTLSKTKATIYTAGTTKVTLTATKAGISGTVKYKSSNTKVAAVSSKGVVTAKKKGTVTITATCGSYKATCKVTVKNPSLTLSKTAVSVKVGKTATISAKAVPTGTIKYRSSNTKVATVSSKGVIKGIKKGTATIKVTCNGVSKTIKVTVK